MKGILLLSVANWSTRNKVNISVPSKWNFPYLFLTKDYLDLEGILLTEVSVHAGCDKF